MTTMLPILDVTEAEDVPRVLDTRATGQDKVFRAVIRTAGILVLTIMSLIGVFLAIRASDAISAAGGAFVTTEAWNPDAGDFGIAAVLAGTFCIAIVAVLVAFPLATGTALYLSEYAPRRLRSTLLSLVDLMAAVPSVVYGLWGLFFFQNQATGIARWVSTWFGWVPFLDVPGVDPSDPLTGPTPYTSSLFIAGVVVGLMVTPIATSVMREVFSQAPVGEREGALALGATKLGMIRSVVLPFGKGGMIGGMMLGLGRALGETIVVYMILSQVFVINLNVLSSGGSSVSSLIALRYGEATPFATSALMAAGLVLFLVTLVVNFVASSFVARSRSGASSDA